MLKNLFNKGKSKVTSVVDKLHSFPEWHQMDTALENCLKSTVKKQSHFEIAQGQSYSEFARKTNESISDILNQINENLTGYFEEEKKGTEALPKLRSDLTKLKTLNDGMKAKIKERDNMKDRAKKSSNAADKAEKKLEQLRLKNPSSPDCARAEDEYNRAVQQRQADQTAYEEREALLVTERKEYKKQLFSCILTSLGEYAAAKKEASEGMYPFGDKIKEIAITIPTYTDPTIEVLQTQVQALRSEPVE